jgi:hypothetical protein
MTSRICVGCLTISKLLKLRAFVCAISEVVVDYALFPTMNHAGAVETMDAAAVWNVAALAARLPKVLIQSDDAHLWVVDRGGPMMMDSELHD